MYNFLLNMFSRQFLQRLAHSLWDKESEEEPKPIGDGQDAQWPLQANSWTESRVCIGRIAVLGRIQKSGSTNDGTCLSSCSRDSVTGGAQTSREQLCWHNEGSGIRSEIGEEESESIHDDEGDMIPPAEGGGVGARTRRTLEVVVVPGQDRHEQSHEEESLELDDPSADQVHSEDSDPVAGHSGAEGNDCLSTGNSVNLLQSTHVLGGRNPSNSRKHILLEQILGVESHIEEKPSRASADKVKSMPLEKGGGEKTKFLACGANLPILLLEFHLEHLGQR